MDRKERQRIAKRDYMRRCRAIPEERDRINALRRIHREKYALRQRERHRINRETRLFYWRSKLFNAHYKTTYSAHDFAQLWKLQRGQCGLTGQRLSSDNCHIDHVVPISRGGGHQLSNLRWTTTRANQAKGMMTDPEFTELCSSVAQWIARQTIKMEGAYDPTFHSIPLRGAYKG